MEICHQKKTEEESHFGSPKCMVLRCWGFWDYIHFYSPSNARKYVLLFTLIHTMGHPCFFPRYQWYHSLLMNQNESYLHLPTLRLLFPIKFPMIIIQSSCQPHCGAKLAMWFRDLYGLTTMQQHITTLLRTNYSHYIMCFQKKVMNFQRWKVHTTYGDGLGMVYDFGRTTIPSWF